MEKEKIAQMMHDKWFAEYGSRKKSSFEEYTEIVVANNSLIENMNKGINCIANRLYDEAIKALSLGIDTGEQLLLNSNLIDESELAKSYLNRGVAYQYLKKFEKALSDKSKSVDLLERIYSEGNLNNENDLALAYMNRGQTYGSMGQYYMDIADTNKSIQIWEQMKREGKLVDETTLALAYANKSSTESKAGLSQNTEEGELDEVLKNMSNSIKLLKNSGHNSEKYLATTYTMRGLLSFQYYRFLEAISDFDESIKIVEGINNRGEQFDVNDFAKAHVGRGLSYHILGETNIAIPNLKKGIELWEILQNDGKHIDSNMLYLAQTILATAINTSYENMEEAISYNFKAMEIASQVGIGEDVADLNNLAINHMILGVSCDQKKLFNEANEHYSICINIWEQLCNDNKEFDEVNMALAYMNRGSNYYSMGIISKTVSDYCKAINIMECTKKSGKKHDECDLFMAYKNRSQAYEVYGNAELAVKDLIKAMKILKEVFQSRLDLQLHYYEIFDELIELIAEEGNNEQTQCVLQEFLYSMRQVPKTPEAEKMQDSLITRFINFNNAQ